eukprot:6395959-Ditylum_brightwellii.AAC.1
MASKFIVSLGKIGYAFLFQEVHVDLDLTDSDLMSSASSTAAVNIFADLITSGDDFSLSNNFGLYPGTEKCNTKSLHTLWHQ